MSATIKIAASALALTAASILAPALADELKENCVAKATANNPEVSDPEAACSCVAEAADETIAEELATATDPSKLSEGALDVLRSCGFNV